ncbi:uncharacterized protein STEHIDRAFT_130055 [Stereum hirsutum FP-91666 SS1]|uniref:uncharacterized protein n=1 Tax=Stereum hirsutum (strain FP-91666) TaxID=721885 RepID=UPI000440FA0F|nr:uncharacterized protein STEHIDRAFT_130055 [Stereum hirsutum FP-91666 SS1]EIM88087.1 hypothetical protein STEHIDRAFT_130055 [Stereum hirsutum FP-91666 SS1]
MADDSNNFLFASLGDKQGSTARKVHIRRLYDILQLCILRNDIPRAKRAWSILARCKEIDWKDLWKYGLLLLGDAQADVHNTGESNGNTRASESRIEYLRKMRMQHPSECETILMELVLLLISLERQREALEELELWLTTFPYQDNSVLHTYRGLLSLYLAQPSNGASSVLFDPSGLRDAQVHLERAKALDPGNVVASAFLDKLPHIINNSPGRKAQPNENESEDDDHGSTMTSGVERRKRMRT